VSENQTGDVQNPDRPTKAERRAQRETELAAKQVSLPDKRYGVILADPEWRFEPYRRDTGMDRAAEAREFRIGPMRRSGLVAGAGPVTGELRPSIRATRFAATVEAVPPPRPRQ
jgi:hypothetical protein